MKIWRVVLPIAGHAVREVEAEDEDSAIDAAFADDGLTIDDIEEWETMRHITRGNVCYAPTWDAYAEEICDVEEVPAPPTETIAEREKEG